MRDAAGFSNRRQSTAFSIDKIISSDDKPRSANRGGTALSSGNVPVVVRPWEQQEEEETGRMLTMTSNCLRWTATAAAVAFYHTQMTSRHVSPLCALYRMTAGSYTDPLSTDVLQVSHLHGMTVAGPQKPQHPVNGATAGSAVVKKRRKSRTAFTSYQLQQLERCFSRHKYLLPADRDVTARRLGLSSAQVITWFQNRRAKLKRDLEELRADVDAARSLTSTTSAASSPSSRGIASSSNVSALSSLQ